MSRGTPLRGLSATPAETEASSSLKYSCARISFGLARRSGLNASILSNRSLEFSSQPANCLVMLPARPRTPRRYCRQRGLGMAATSRHEGVPTTLKKRSRRAFVRVSLRERAATSPSSRRDPYGTSSPLVPASPAFAFVVYVSAVPGFGTGSSSNRNRGEMVRLGVNACCCWRCRSSPKMHPSAQTSIAPVYPPLLMITSGAR
mmetsp:Transcript_3934/g.15667  ORF Transcript_3934/g.15667 Transcript_3934/m.15667 type:complete len:203 (+) Transcript_3934:1030-1638(+)